MCRTLRSTIMFFKIKASELWRNWRPTSLWRFMISLCAAGWRMWLQLICRTRGCRKGWLKFWACQLIQSTPKTVSSEPTWLWKYVQTRVVLSATTLWISMLSHMNINHISKYSQFYHSGFRRREHVHITATAMVKTETNLSGFDHYITR